MCFHGWGWPGAQRKTDQGLEDPSGERQGEKAGQGLWQKWWWQPLWLSSVCVTLEGRGPCDSSRELWAGPHPQGDIGFGAVGLGCGAGSSGLWLWFLLGYLTDGAGVTITLGSSPVGPMLHEGPQPTKWLPPWSGLQQELCGGVVRRTRASSRLLLVKGLLRAVLGLPEDLSRRFYLFSVSDSEWILCLSPIIPWANISCLCSVSPTNKPYSPYVAGSVWWYLSQVI